MSVLRVRLTRSFAATLMGWSLVCAVLVAAAATLLGAAADRALLSAAQDSAAAFARTLSARVPAVLDSLDRGELDAATDRELQWIGPLADLVRLTLFDSTGRLLVDSPSPASLPPVAAAPSWLPAEPDVQGVRRVAGGHEIDARILRASWVARTPVYVEAYVPLWRDGQVVGVAALRSDMSARTQRLRSAFFEAGAVIGVVLATCAAALLWLMRQRRRERRQAERRLQDATAQDALCGLVNRRRFCEVLGQAAQRQAAGGPGFTLLALDLARFRDVNDRHGHTVGDAVLRATADRLRSMVRGADVVARLGADQFAVLLADVTDGASVRAFAERAMALLAQPVDAEAKRVDCLVRAGAARFGIDADGVDSLLHSADVALTRAKEYPGAAFCFYELALDRRLEARRQLAHDLQQALAGDALALHYQALIDSRSGAVTGYEALMRWAHPQHGMVPPSEFITLAEEVGLIESLGAWALRRACADASRWPEPSSVAVNLSAAQFHGEIDLPTLVERTLAETSLAPHRLGLEITESLLMRDTEQARHALVSIADLGVRIALDDFGTGHSSLAYLWRFPIHKLKIDRAFTQGLGDDPKVELIVRSIVSLAHAMGLRVNAEGVETVKQRDCLCRLGCDELQGFLLGRPAALNRAADSQPKPLAPALALT